MGKHRGNWTNASECVIQVIGSGEGILRVVISDTSGTVVTIEGTPDELQLFAEKFMAACVLPVIPLQRIQEVRYGTARTSV